MGDLVGGTCLCVLFDAVEKSKDYALYEVIRRDNSYSVRSRLHQREVTEYEDLSQQLKASYLVILVRIALAVY